MSVAGDVTTGIAASNPLGLVVAILTGAGPFKDRPARVWIGEDTTTPGVSFDPISGVATYEPPPQGPNPGGFEVLPPLVLEPGENPGDFNERGDPIGGDSDVEWRDSVGLPQVPPGGVEVYPVEPLPPAPLPGGPTDADNMRPRWINDPLPPIIAFPPAGGRRRGGKRKRSKQYTMPPVNAFVGPLPGVEAGPFATTVAAAIARVAPWLAVLWPSEVSPDIVPAPSGPTRRRRFPELDPTDPYPSRRERFDRPAQPMIPGPEIRTQPPPLEMPAPYVPPQPRIVPRVDVPAMPSLPELYPEIPVQPGPATRPAPAPARRPAPAPTPRTAPVRLPFGLPWSLPFLPLYLPTNRPGTQPIEPFWQTPTGPGNPLPGPTSPTLPDFPSLPDPLTPPSIDPLPLAQPQPYSSAYRDCIDTLKRRPKTRKCVQRDDCGRCTRYRKL